MLEPILFSIIIPTYNRSFLIKDTINSFLKQTYSNFEIIIVDDGSTDDTETVVKSFIDKRVNYQYKKNGERGAARNFGATLAKGLYLNFFDSDDIAFENHLNEAFNATKILKEPMVFHLGMNMKNLNGKKIFSVKNTKSLKKIFRCNYVNPNAVFIHSYAFDQVKYNEDRLLSGSEDWLFHLQLASRFQFIPFDKSVQHT